MAMSIRHWRSTLRLLRQGRTWCQLTGYYSNRCQKLLTFQEEQSTSQSEGQPSDLDDLLTDRSIGYTDETQQAKLKLNPDQPVNPHLLRVAIIGTYNSGKSTLTNRLMGWKVSPASSKIHTTQENVLAVHTEENTQIIFRDTPGLIRGSRISTKQREKLQKSIKEDPKKSLVDADLICVLVDASDRWDVEFLDENVYYLLKRNKHIPSVLILNKIDLVKDSNFLLHITRALTMDTVGKEKIRITTGKRRPTWKVEDIREAMKTDGKRKQAVKNKLDSLFNRVDKVRGTAQKKPDDPASGVTRESHEGQQEMEKGFEGQQETGESHEGQQQAHEEGHCEGHSKSNVSPQYTDIGRPDIPEHVLLKSLPNGWDSFDRVFMLSALHGKGVQALKDYLLSRALSRDWCYHSSVVTDQNPYRFAEKIVWETMLECLPKEIPYKYFPVVRYWLLEHDVLVIHMDINMFKTKHMQMAIGPKGSIIKKIRQDSHAALMDAFRCDIILRLKIHNEDNKNKEKSKHTKLKTIQKSKNRSAKSTSKSNYKDTSNIEDEISKMGNSKTP
ncbi:GTPase Era, mitochondrial-like isoform X3 [Mizuhopecten yessoensis]|uniref:GTPase Era, mitochondrial-like isoform X2 n=1 Tax=Mizuhopecten yessoensis TaxID=6573 RepID=UPI000B4584B4|nr:GTPase Era, mitochondrial-like isoform X2 [Mizuhopecten yessoensis]XP_021349893.1 GTPase Era, mitochondrial-like isoform X3 [Mizuhopecten yessoensis]